MLKNISFVFDDWGKVWRSKTLANEPTEGKILMGELHVLQPDSKKIMPLLAGFLIFNFANFSHFNIFIHTVFVHY